MLSRKLATLGVAALCLSAQPISRPAAPPPLLPASRETSPPTDRPPTAEEFAYLARTDAVAMLDAAAQRYKREVRGFRATLHKQERVNGELHPPEVIHVCVREEPYAVLMLWSKGSRAVKIGGFSLGTVEGALYAVGENEGRMLVWRPSALLSKFTPADPLGDQAQAASRYALLEAGIGQALDRTRRAWEESRDQGKLRCEFVGTKPIPELGGRVCHVVRRTCNPAEADPFLSTDPRPDAAKRPGDAFTSVTVMIDVETWMQLGTEVRRADGEVVGTYYFRDVERNPAFGPEQFKRAALK